jgi:hypothetical protein
MMEEKKKMQTAFLTRSAPTTQSRASTVSICSGKLKSAMQSKVIK